MPFTSPLYYAFLLLTAVVAFQSPKRHRATILLFASYVFYCSYDPRFLVFILTTTMVGYAAARFMETQRAERKRALALTLAIAVELALLGFTKYWNPLATATGWFSTLAILVPLGISFYTFQSIGYLVDVHRRTIAVEKNPARYALFLSFFPHLLAGPIEPARNFLPQLQVEPPFEAKRAWFGVMLIAVGLFKKFVIADRVAPVVALVFDNAAQHGGLGSALGVVLARYQIYADFSGYTDIALGSAQILGYQLSPNFRRPFFADSISEYWRRWHISLSQWIRDYVFFPLATSPLRRLGVPGLLVITFVILGLWHGASLNFVLYGLWQGVFVGIDVATKRTRTRFYERSGLSRFPKFLGAICILATFFLLVVPPTLFFRSPTFSTSLSLLHELAKPWRWSDLSFVMGSAFLKGSLGIAGAGIVGLEFMDWLQEKSDLQEYLWHRSRWYFAAAVGGLFAVTLLFGIFAENVPFIYLRF
jgi:alginate O-acetyltransferase complex protein AlgI